MKFLPTLARIIITIQHIFNSMSRVFEGQQFNGEYLFSEQKIRPYEYNERFLKIEFVELRNFISAIYIRTNSEVFTNVSKVSNLGVYFRFEKLSVI